MLLSWLPLTLLLVADRSEGKETTRPLWQHLDATDPSVLYASLWTRTSSPKSGGVGEEAGGGLFEEHLRRTLDDTLLSRKFEALTKGEQLAQKESRDLRCCEHVEVQSTGGVASTHPYVLGSYTKIGECSGRSFYRHLNNSDIYLYHACTSWYFGLTIGSCGGWMLSQSIEPCVTSSPKWQYYDEGQLKEDESFEVVANCQLFHDFRPLPPGLKHPIYAPHFEPVSPATPTDPWPVFRQPSSSSSLSEMHRHEHFHYHFRMDEQNPKYKPIVQDKAVFEKRHKMDDETEVPRLVINNVNINADSDALDNHDHDHDHDDASKTSLVSVVLRKKRKRRKEGLGQHQHRSMEKEKSSTVDVLDFTGKLDNLKQPQ